MSYKLVQKPVIGAEAFAKHDESAVQSQAAILLLLGRQLRGDDSALTARAANVGGKKRLATIASTGAAEFPVPKLRGSTTRISPAATQAAIASRHGPKVLATKTRRAGGKPWKDACQGLGEELYKSPTPEAAAQLMEVCLTHPDELTRVAAAASYFSLSASPQKLIAILAQGTLSQEPLVRDVAATALARVAPDHASLRPLLQTKPVKGRRKPAHTALLVHGTFAANEPWWQPNGDFHSYVLQKVRSDLYSGTDRFGWSGGYSDSARSQAATDLVAWVRGHQVEGLDLLGHSHGANAMMLATQMGMKAGKLILLSCPVRVDQYFPKFALVKRLVSIRVKNDLVIMADRAGQEFSDPRIEEHVLPIWFNHSATHDPAVWKKHKIPTLI